MRDGDASEVCRVGVAPAAAVRDDRGQTNIDFAVGVSILLTVVIFVFVFAPGILSPFTGGNQEETVVAGRIADQLSRGMLGSPTEPNVLDRRCALAFFQGKDPVEPATGPNEGVERDCRYLEDRSAISSYPVEERVGVKETFAVNVTIEGDLDSDGSKSPICWDDGNAEFEEKDTGDCDNDNDGTIDDTVLFAGDLKPESTDVITTRRTVSIHDRNVTMLVHVA